MPRRASLNLTAQTLRYYIQDGGHRKGETGCMERGEERPDSGGLWAGREEQRTQLADHKRNTRGGCGQVHKPGNRVRELSFSGLQSPAAG